MNTALFAVLSTLSVIGTLALDYEKQYYEKHACWSMILFVTAFKLAPVLRKANLTMINQSLMATGCTVGGLGLIAYNAPSD